MPELLQRPADDESELDAGQCLSVRERFFSLTPGQEVEVTDVSDETTDEDYPERITLRVAGQELPTLVEAAEMDYHGSDIKQAVDRGTLELQ